MMKQKAREQGISDQQIENNCDLAIKTHVTSMYEGTHSGLPTPPTVNAEFFYWLVDQTFREQTLGREEPFGFEDPFQWYTRDKYTAKPWSPEYLAFYMQRALIEGDGRGTVTTEDGGSVQLQYEPCIA